MSTVARGGSDRTVTVCIDHYDEGQMQGRFFHSSANGGHTFRSAIQFLSQMERTLDAAEYPKAYTSRRVFTPLLSYSTETPSEDFPSGKLATFALRILFRHNAGWQGSVAWLEGRQEHSFRSVLELLLLLDSALTATGKAS